MDAMFAATAFATIVSLLGQFRSERSNQKEIEVDTFLEWLITSNHTDLKELLENNSQAIDGIKKLLKEDSDILLQKLEDINNALLSFTSGVEGFSQIVEAINPNAIISDQAISILRQIDESNSSTIIKLNTFDGDSLKILGGENIKISELRFIEDDLYRLTELGLLIPDINSQGLYIYKYTRAASKLIAAISGKND